MRVVLLHHYYTSESRCDKNQEIEVMFMENRMKKNGIEYVLAGEYYIPDLKLPAEERPIGKYGRMHRERLPGLQQLPENLPPPVRHHSRRIPCTEPDSGALTIVS